MQGPGTIGLLVWFCFFPNAIVRIQDSAYLAWKSGDYEVLGAINHVWQSHNCLRYAIAIEVEEDSWEVIIPRSCIPALEDCLRKGRIHSYVNRNYDPCRPRTAEVQKHGVRVAAFLARRSFWKRVEGDFGPFISLFYRHYVDRNAIIL